MHTPSAAGGLHYSDPRLAIVWPLPPVDVTERDRDWPLLADAEAAIERARIALHTPTPPREAATDA